MTPHAKKRFGQHFLRDTGVLDRIVRLIRPRTDDLVVEIGAGQGALTARLAPAVTRLIAVEIDLDCLPGLRAAVEPYPSVRIERADILQSDLGTLLAPWLQSHHRLRFVGNLPFNISTAIIEKVLQSSLPVHDMIFMVQLEVAQRIIAKPGSRDYGYLSVFCRHRAEVRQEFAVSPACFVPRPRVTSAVVTIIPKGRAWDADMEQNFSDLAKAAFSYRRKTVVNSLGRDPVFGSAARKLLAMARIDESLRPEQLAVDDYERLAEAAQSREPGD